MTTGLLTALYGAGLVAVSGLFVLAARRSEAEGRRPLERGGASLEEPTWPHVDAAWMHRVFALVMLALAALFVALGAWLDPWALTVAVALAVPAVAVVREARRGPPSRPGRRPRPGGAAPRRVER